MALTSFQITEHETNCRLLIAPDDPFISGQPKVIMKSNASAGFNDYQKAAREYADAWMQHFASHDFDAQSYSYENDDQDSSDDTESGYSDHLHCSPEAEICIELVEETQAVQKKVERNKRRNKKKENWIEDIFEPIVDRKGNCYHNKPKLSFTSLIALSINSTNSKDGVSVQEIYNYITDRFPHFEQTPIVNWKNSIRHNLSHSGVFCKSKFHRTAKKGYNWKIKPGGGKKIKKEVKKYLFTEIRHIKHIMRSSGKQMLEC